MLEKRVKNAQYARNMPGKCPFVLTSVRTIEPGEWGLNQCFLITPAKISLVIHISIILHNNDRQCTTWHYNHSHQCTLKSHSSQYLHIILPCVVIAHHNSRALTVFQRTVLLISVALSQNREHAFNVSGRGHDKSNFS